MSVLILGKTGQVGSELMRLLGDAAFGLDSRELDLLSSDAVQKLDSLVPGDLRALINAAAYTKVDLAEGEGAADSRRLNAELPGELAHWCKGRGIPFIHYSTDYVFDGSGDAPRAEGEQTAPLNAYGRDKLAGEQAVAASGAQHLIFRTSWVYSADGKNFFNTMLRLMHEREELQVVCDQVGAPTYAPDLAVATLEALRRLEGGAPVGIYHLCNAGHTSWHAFAEAILTLARSKDSGIKCERIQPIVTASYPTPAIRPLNSRLDCSKVGVLLGIALPHWEQGLKECAERKYASAGLPDRRP